MRGQPSTPSQEPLERADMQGLVMSAYGHMGCAAYHLLQITDAARTRTWLASHLDEITTARAKELGSSVNVAFTHAGLEALGLPEDTLATFPHAFRDGMNSERRGRILGDTGPSASAEWDWGGPDDDVHILLLIFGQEESDLNARVARERADAEAAGLRLAAAPLEAGRQPDSKEHFGYADGVGQPVIEGSGNKRRQMLRTGHATDVKPGEFILGYRNEYGKPAPSPSVDPAHDPAGLLPRRGVAGEPERHDLGRNGSYLVFRQMAQHVGEFRSFLEDATRRADGTADAGGGDRPGAKTVGLRKGGAPLVKHPEQDPHGGKVTLRPDNDFEYAADDLAGVRCPLGSHIRRANPRDGLGPDPETALKSARRHRLLRRGRSYGDRLPEGATEDGAPRGLHFLCLNSDLERQFEFVQQTWLDNRVFAGLYREADPIMGNQDPTDRLFTVPGDPVRTRVHALRHFVTVKGGGYFFLPGMRALRYLAEG